MNSIFTILLSIMCSFGLTSTSCDSNTNNHSSYVTQQKPTISFQLPKRWNLITDDLKAFTSYKSKETNEDYDVIMVWGSNDDNQTDEDAKSQATHEAKTGCPGNSKYLEDKVAGRNIYMAIEKGCVIYAGSSPYETRIFFIENKHLVTVVLGENYDNFKPDIEMMLKTFYMNF